MGTRGVSRFAVRRSARRSVRWVAGALVIALLAVIAAVNLLAVRVQGVSMTPTFTDGERVLLRPYSSGDTPARLSVVVGKFAEGGQTVIKRVIGLPGDRVRIDTSGTAPRVEVQPGGQGAWLEVANPAWDGRWNSVPLACCRPDGKAGGRTGPQTVPPGMLFLLGDHPAASEDTRTFGWAPIRLVDGVVRWRLRAWVFPSGVSSAVELRAIS
jgi:signal peptidase I